MIRYDRRTQALAAGLCALAGYVDAIGFMQTGGFFVSFMSGNSTRLAVGLATRTPNPFAAAALIGMFILGVVVGSVTGGKAGFHRRRAVLALVTALLFFAAAGGAMHRTLLTIGLTALAMGAENAVFEEAGEIRIGLTYMTGTLVKVGQRLAAVITGGDKAAWAPYVLLWASLVCGAVAGASTYARFGLTSLWIAVIASTAFTLSASPTLENS